MASVETNKNREKEKKNGTHELAVEMTTFQQKQRSNS
jgi:hypothetical protein